LLAMLQTGEQLQLSQVEFGELHLLQESVFKLLTNKPESYEID